MVSGSRVYGTGGWGPIWPVQSTGPKICGYRYGYRACPAQMWTGQMAPSAPSANDVCLQGFGGTRGEGGAGGLPQPDRFRHRNRARWCPCMEKSIRVTGGKTGRKRGGNRGEREERVVTQRPSVRWSRNRSVQVGFHRHCAPIAQVKEALTPWWRSDHRGKDKIATGAGVDNPRTRPKHGTGGKSRNG